MSADKMPCGELGYCVVKAGHEQFRGGEGTHEWRTPQLAHQFLCLAGQIMAHEGDLEEFSHYYVAGPDRQRVK